MSDYRTATEELRYTHVEIVFCIRSHGLLEALEGETRREFSGIKCRMRRTQTRLRPRLFSFEASALFAASLPPSSLEFRGIHSPLGSRSQRGP